MEFQHNVISYLDAKKDDILRDKSNCVSRHLFQRIKSLMDEEKNIHRFLNANQLLTIVKKYEHFHRVISSRFEDAVLSKKEFDYINQKLHDGKYRTLVKTIISKHLDLSKVDTDFITKETVEIKKHGNWLSDSLILEQLLHVLPSYLRIFNNSIDTLLIHLKNQTE